MKTNEFVKIIKQVIREEVKKAVKDELNTFLTEVYTAPSKSKVTPKTNKQVRPAVAAQPKTNNFDMYGPLSQLLQETANSMTSADYNNNGGNDWSDMGTFTSDHISSENMGDFGEYNPQLSHTFGDNDDLPNSPTNSLIRDYSAVMKAADDYKMGKH
jgi:hypothetical protein